MSKRKPPVEAVPMVLCPNCGQNAHVRSASAERAEPTKVYGIGGHYGLNFGRDDITYIYETICDNGCEVRIRTTKARDDFRRNMEMLYGRGQSTAPAPPTADEREEAERQLERIGAAAKEIEG